MYLDSTWAPRQHARDTHVSGFQQDVGACSLDGDSVVVTLCV